MENSMEVTQLKTELPFDPKISLLGIYPKELSQVTITVPAHPRLLQHLFPIAKLWKQPRCSTTNKWIKKMWYLYAMKFYSVIKENEILSVTAKWMELENTILSKVS
jgi:hypothetical protein